MKGKHRLDNSLHPYHPTIARQDPHTETFYKLA
jgi:hypothetical protein